MKQPTDQDLEAAALDVAFEFKMSIVALSMT
jgi:hypothetical protein